MKIKRGVEEALGLPPSDDLNKYFENSLYDEDDDDESNNYDITKDDIEEARRSMIKLKEFRQQLKDIPDITARKTHLDRLAIMAEQKFEDIFDRGFNCEDRYMADIINAANNMLKIALDAHAKVIDSDIKLIDMQIKKDKIEIELNQKNPNLSLENTEKEVDGDKVVYKSRNDILTSKKRNK